MNPNLSSNLRQQMCSSTTSSSYMSSQGMAPNVSQNAPIGQQMESAITSTSNPMVSQSQHPSQQSQQPSVQSMQSGMGGMVGRDLNIASVCRVGDETVQNIVTKTAELFQTLRVMSPPNGAQQGVQERQLRTKELLKAIEQLFRQLRMSYEKCNECLSAIDYIQIESIIPMTDQDFHKVEDKKFTNVKARQLDKEHKDLEDLLLLKNRQIKEIIDNLRAIVWEINTMLAMRKP